jgi:hypothetical protein
MDKDRGPQRRPGQVPYAPLDAQIISFFLCQRGFAQPGRKVQPLGSLEKMLKGRVTEKRHKVCTLLLNSGLPANRVREHSLTNHESALFNTFNSRRFLNYGGCEGDYHETTHQRY